MYDIAYYVAIFSIITIQLWISQACNFLLRLSEIYNLKIRLTEFIKLVMVMKPHFKFIFSVWTCCVTSYLAATCYLTLNYTHTYTLTAVYHKFSCLLYYLSLRNFIMSIWQMISALTIITQMLQLHKPLLNSEKHLKLKANSSLVLGETLFSIFF